MWVDVDTRFEMVGGRDAKIGWGWACHTSNRVRRNIYWSGAEGVVRDRLQSPQSDEKAGVVVVECREWKIGRGRVFALPNRNRARGAWYWSGVYAVGADRLGAHACWAIAKKVWGRWPNVNARVDVGVEVVGRYVGDNKQPAACSKLNQ